MRTTSIASGVVTRRPPLNSDSMPSRPSMSVICGPPPCTTTGLRPKQPQVHDVLGEGALEDVVHHGVAAVLDDDDGALELLDPRHRVDEDADLLLRVEVGGIDEIAHELYALFSWT